jgi:dGTPase
VSSIAREIARPLGLIDPLVDAIALGHDIGHPAFGHAGERALAAFVPGGFHHAAHGVRVVTVLEPELDLSPEVVDGILKHSKGRAGSVFARGAALGNLTREALVVRAADLFAYACHDLDDAYLIGALRPADLPRRTRDVLGSMPAEVRCTVVGRTVRTSLAAGDVSIDPETGDALQELRDFLYERLYEGPRIARQTAFVRSLVEQLWESALERRGSFDVALDGLATGLALGSSLARGFVDVMAALTDRQVLQLARTLGLPPRAWSLPDFVTLAPLASGAAPSRGERARTAASSANSSDR